MFFNELDMLEGRLEYLYDTVDYFIIVENDLTHNGNKKPMHYASNIERYRKYQKKIIYLPLSTNRSKYDWNRLPSSDPTAYSAWWAVENYQRNHIAQGLKLFKPSDIVMISDIDEVPNKAAIRRSVNSLNDKVPAVTLLQDMFYYNLKQKQTAPWAGTVITTNKAVSERTPQWFRKNRWAIPSIEDAGWHMSYWMTLEQIQNKIMNFAHQEYNVPEFTDLHKIAERVHAGVDLFGRETSTTGTHTEFVSVDRNSLNTEMLSVFEKYEPKYVPHYCDQVEGFFNPGDFAFYKEIIEQTKGSAHFVEVGSFKGKSASFMAVEIANSNKDIKFDCVDTWEGSPEHQTDQAVVNNNLFEVFKTNMEPVKDYYSALRLPSVKAAATYKDNSLDFVFIDADHSYESVREDIIAWYPKVKKGGIISGHDYHMGAPGVINASNELLGVVRVTGSCWWHKKINLTI